MSSLTSEMKSDLMLRLEKLLFFGQPRNGAAALRPAMEHVVDTLGAQGWQHWERFFLLTQWEAKVLSVTSAVDKVPHVTQRIFYGACATAQVPVPEWAAVVQHFYVYRKRRKTIGNSIHTTETRTARAWWNALRLLWCRTKGKVPFEVFFFARLDEMAFSREEDGSVIVRLPRPGLEKNGFRVPAARGRDWDRLGQRIDAARSLLEMECVSHALLLPHECEWASHDPAGGQFRWINHQNANQHAPLDWMKEAFESFAYLEFFSDEMEPLPRADSSPAAQRDFLLWLGFGIARLEAAGYDGTPLCWAKLRKQYRAEGALPRRDPAPHGSQIGSSSSSSTESDPDLKSSKVMDTTAEGSGATMTGVEVDPFDVDPDPTGF